MVYFRVPNESNLLNKTTSVISARKQLTDNTEEYQKFPPYQAKRLDNSESVATKNPDRVGTRGKPRLLRYNCSTCRTSFKSGQLLINHQVSKHKRRFTRDICNKEFKTPSQLAAHRMPIANSGNHPSDKSPQRIATSQALLAHMELRHQERAGQHRCNTCGMQFSESMALLNHQSQHQTCLESLTGNPLTCPRCARTFINVHGLKIHQSSCRAKKVNGMTTQIFINMLPNVTTPTSI